MATNSIQCQVSVAYFHTFSAPWVWDPAEAVGGGESRTDRELSDGCTPPSVNEVLDGWEVEDVRLEAFSIAVPAVQPHVRFCLEYRTLIPINTQCHVLLRIARAINF